MDRKNIQCENVSSTISSDERSIEENEQGNREEYGARDSSTPDVDVDQVANDREYMERNSSSSSDMSFHEDAEETKEYKGGCIFHPHHCDDVYYEEDLDARHTVDDDEDDVFTESSSPPNSDFIAAAKDFDNLDYDPYDPDHLDKWYEEQKANESKNSGSDRDINVHIDDDVNNGGATTGEIVNGDEVDAREQVDVYSKEDVEVQAVYENLDRNEDVEYEEREISSSRDSDIDVDIEEDEIFDYDLIDPDQLINWQQNHDDHSEEYRDRSPLNFSDRKLYEEDDENYEHGQFSTTHENLNQDATLEPVSFKCDAKKNVNVVNNSLDNIAVEDVEENTIEIVAPNEDMNEGVDNDNKIENGPNENANRGAVWSPPDAPCDITIAMILKCIRDDKEKMDENHACHE